MPTYDYRCDANDRELEVRHSMSTDIGTWGELCAVADIDPGDTAADAPVKRLATGGNLVTGNSGAEEPMPRPGGCCGGGACGIH